MPKSLRHALTAGVVMFMVAAGSSVRAGTDGLFEGVWARSCAHLSGETFTFHDGDRLKVVDLDCKIRGWKRRGEHFRSALLCTLDGVEQRSHVEVLRIGGWLRITLGGRTQTVRRCS